MCLCDSLRVSYFLLQDKKSTSTTDADDDQPVHPVEADGHCSNQVDSLRFEVKIYLQKFLVSTRKFRSRQSLAL